MAQLTPFISQGITILIATAVVAGSLFSLLSACRPVVAMPDDDTAPILALMVTLVVGSFPAGTAAEVLFVTAFGALTFTAFLTGVVLAALGYFKLGSLVRYLPYSVMGGYFAGAGLLLIQGALKVVTDLPLVTAADFMHLVDAEVMWRWMPAIVAAWLIRWAIRHCCTSRWPCPRPCSWSIALFFVVAAIAGLSPD